jgi:hypothetical protein
VRRDWGVWLIPSAAGLRRVAPTLLRGTRQQLQASRHRSKHGHIALAALDDHVMAERLWGTRHRSGYRELLSWMSCATSAAMLAADDDLAGSLKDPTMNPYMRSTLSRDDVILRESDRHQSPSGQRILLETDG